MGRRAAILRIAREIQDLLAGRDLGLIAAGVAFFGFLSVFPALAAVIALWGFAADPSVIRAQLALAADYLPPEAYTLLVGQAERFLAAGNRSLGWASAASTLVALWSARAGVGALLRGVAAVHGRPVPGGLWQAVRALVLTLLLVALVLSAVAVAVVVPLVLALLPLGPGEALALEAANFLLGLALVVLAIGAIYRLSPIWGETRPRLLTPGLAVAVVLWALVSRGLVLYLSSFGSYGQVYGSFGAVVALMLWFYGAAWAILAGAAVDAASPRARCAEQG